MRGIRVLCAVVAMVLMSVLLAPSATARVGLTPGMKIIIGNGSCTLGFLATNAAGDRLGVTAGHCADRTGEEVRSVKGNYIGRVVSHRGDSGTGGPPFGIALIQLGKSTYTHDAFFTKFGNPSVGDNVRKYGSRTEGTNGRITELTIDTERPRYSVMRSALITLPGDSGCPWYWSKDGNQVLYGMHIGSYTGTRSDGLLKEAYGFPIRSIVSYVREASDVWGPGFIPLGR